MPWILSKIIPSKALAKELLILRKTKAEFIVTNLETFGLSSFIIIKNTRMHSIRKRTTCLLTVSCSFPLGGSTPPPPMQTPWRPPAPVNRMTDRCKNIFLPQTSFAGGKNVVIMNRRKCQKFLMLLEVTVP